MRKLSQTKLVKSTRNNLLELGFQELKDTISGASGLFAKHLHDDFFLTLGLTISNYYDSRFTASFYLSKTIRWSSVWDDIPLESYRRIGRFLSVDERKNLLDMSFNLEKEGDAWWDGSDELQIANFLKTVAITEGRFLGQENIFDKIESSSEVKLLHRYSSGVIALVSQNKLPLEYHYKYMPNRIIDDIPLEWFKAAELVLLENKGILNVDTVKLLASDAWHQFNLKSW